MRLQPNVVVVKVQGLTRFRFLLQVITGFLGSGKTTLLNRILTEDHGQRIAVIENEFGEIDIDSDLVSIRQNLDPSKEQIMMLNNGCLCCTVRDDLIEMLNALVSSFKFYIYPYLNYLHYSG